MLDGTYYFECVCGSAEHTLRFTLNHSYGEPEIYADIFLNNRYAWWERWYVAIRYALGYKCKYGHWDSWILCRDDAKELRKMLDEFICATERTV